MSALRPPGRRDTVFHIHVGLRIFVVRRAVAVLAASGSTPLGPFRAPLHTQDASGSVHVERDGRPCSRRGQFFTVAGVRFSATRLGGYADDGADRVRVHVDGRRVPAPRVLTPGPSRPRAARSGPRPSRARRRRPPA